MTQYYISSNKYSTRERQTKRGKVYDVHFRIVTLDGVEKQKKLSGFTNKTLAKQGYLDFVTKYCELVKNNPIKKKDCDKNVPTINDLFPSYLISLNNQIKESAIYDKRNIFRLFILKEFGEQKISQLSKEVLYRWQDKLWATKNPKTNEFYSYKYLVKTRSHFNSFLSWVESRYGYTNNFKSVLVPKKRTQKTEMQFWTKEEFEKFISVVDNELYKALFSMMFYTGRRKGEIFALTPADIKTDSILFTKTISTKTLDGSAYKITSTKNEKRQSTFICKPLKEILSAYKGQEPFFFGGNRPLPETSVTRVFDNYIKIAEVKRIRIHDLRHSFVSLCVHLGASMPTVAELIGDTLEQVVKTYAHLYENDLKNIISRI